MLLLLFAVLGCIISSSFASEGKVMTEKDLRRYLFADYDKLVRPVKDPNNALVVFTAITPLAITKLYSERVRIPERREAVKIQHVVEYVLLNPRIPYSHGSHCIPTNDEVNQMLVMDSWMLMKWKDDYLTWEPKEFNNITILRIPHTELWKPDLSIYTSTPDDSLFPTSNTRSLIYSDGTVVWVTPFTIKNRCPRQKKQERSRYVCNIRIGSWTYSANLMDVQLTTPEVDLSDFQDTNTKWKLMTAKMNRESKYYPCCVEDYPLIHFNITLKRRFL